MKTTKKIITDMIPVVLGVLIALLIDGWKDHITDRRYVNRIMDSMEKEMVENKKEVTNTLKRQYALLDTLTLYMNDNEVSVVNVVQKSNGVQIPTVKNTSWRSILNSKMEIIDYEIVAKMTEIEEGKQFLRLKAEKLLDFGYAQANSTDEGHKGIFELLILDIIDTQEGLLDHFDELLEIRGISADSINMDGP